jgi:hypothetical protein
VGGGTTTAVALAMGVNFIAFDTSLEAINKAKLRVRK